VLTVKRLECWAAVVSGGCRHQPIGGPENPLDHGSSNRRL